MLKTKNKNDYFKEHLKELCSTPNESVSPEKVKTKALRYIENNHIPTTKHEAWRHLDIEEIVNKKYKNIDSSDFCKIAIVEYLIKGLDANILVFINGKYCKCCSNIISDSRNILISPIQEAKKSHKDIFDKYVDQTNISEDNIFSAYNTAYSDDGLFIYVPKARVLKERVYILNLFDGKGENTFSQKKNLFVIDEDAHVKIIERHHSLNEDTAFSNDTLEIIAEKESTIEYDILQGVNNQSYLINTTKAIQKEGSSVNINTISLDGGIIRNNLTSELIEKRSKANLNGLFLPDKDQRIDNHTNIKHLSPECDSNESYRGILNGKSQGVFCGKVYVEKGASQTNAYQSNKNIVLTKNARVNSMPQLEIYNYDVKCSHGSTTGQIDKNSLFYLQARGIQKKEAQAMLLYGFASEIINKVNADLFRQFVDTLITQKFRGETCVYKNSQ